MVCLSIARFLPSDSYPGIWQNKIDLKTGNSLTPAQMIFAGTLPDDASARPEGPHVYRINETYYLLIAEGQSIEFPRFPLFELWI